MSVERKRVIHLHYVMKGSAFLSLWPYSLSSWSALDLPLPLNREYKEEQHHRLLQAAGAEQTALPHPRQAPHTLEAGRLPEDGLELRTCSVADLKAQELQLLRKRRELEEKLRQQQ